MKPVRLGQWIVDRELGRGGMGQVFLAHEDPAAAPEARQAALKVLSPELAQESGFLQRFQREIDILKKLHHPHIVRFYDSGVEDGRYYYAMEYVPGKNFEELLQERGRLPWREVLDLALQVCPALKHAHDHGIIHRDIKPQNLLRADDGVVKLTDFGVAKVFAGKQLTATGGLVGTAEYLAPEQAAGKPVTNRSDLYSLGIVLYLLLTGRPPFQGRSVLDLMHKHRFAQFDPPQRIVPDIPHDLDEVVCSLMEKDPSHRPASGLVLQRRLESIQRKMARKEQQTIVQMEATEVEHPATEVQGEELSNPGPATLMSRMMRRELLGPPRGALLDFLNHPIVLFLGFALTVGIIVYGFWLRPKPSEAPAEDTPAISEAQRFYNQGNRLFFAGDKLAAREVWQEMIDAFQGVPGEEHWVERAHERLDRLRISPDEEAEHWAPVRKALGEARKLWEQGERDAAERKWQALEKLYTNSPGAHAILKEIQEDRRQVRAATSQPTK